MKYYSFVGRISFKYGFYNLCVTKKTFGETGLQLKFQEEFPTPNELFNNVFKYK